MTNYVNGRKFQVNGNLDEMELFGVGASEDDMGLVLEEREERFLSLGAGDVTPDTSKEQRTLMSAPNLGPRMGSVFRPAVSVGKNMGSKSESVFRSTSSMAQNFRFPHSTVSRPAITPISSPVFAGFPAWENKQKDFDESKARYEEELELGMKLGGDSVMDKLHFAEDFYLGEYPDEIGSRGVFGTKASIAAGGPHYFPSSPPLQSSSPYQQSSGVVPDRFRAGRESLSVIRNVTVRDSKRPKARSQDHDYKRRFSSSVLRPNLQDHDTPVALPVGGGSSPTAIVSRTGVFPSWRFSISSPTSSLPESGPLGQQRYDPWHGHRVPRVCEPGKEGGL